MLVFYLDEEAPPELRDAAIKMLLAATPSSPALQAATGECGVVRALIDLISVRALVSPGSDGPRGSVRSARCALSAS